MWKGKKYSGRPTMKKLLFFVLILTACNIPIFEPEYCDDFYDLHAERDAKIKEYDQIMNEKNARQVVSEQYSLLSIILDSYENDYSDCRIKNIDLLKERAYIQWVIAYQTLGIELPKIYSNWQMITIEELQPIYIDFQEKTGGS